MKLRQWLQGKLIEYIFRNLEVWIDKFCHVLYALYFRAFILMKYIAQFRFAGLSRTCIRIPGLSRPGKWFPEIQGLSRISRTCTNPVWAMQWQLCCLKRSLWLNTSYNQTYYNINFTQYYDKYIKMFICSIVVISHRNETKCSETMRITTKYSGFHFGPIGYKLCKIWSTMSELLRLEQMLRDYFLMSFVFGLLFPMTCYILDKMFIQSLHSHTKKLIANI